MLTENFPRIKHSPRHSEYRYQFDSGMITVTETIIGKHSITIQMKCSWCFAEVNKVCYGLSKG